MAISFGCPHCGRRFEVPDHLEGKQARCQTCGNVVTVAREAVLIAEPVVHEPDLLSASSAEMPGPMAGDPVSPLTGLGGGSGRSGIPPWAVAAIGCGAAVLLGLIVLVVGFAFSSKSEAAKGPRAEGPRAESQEGGRAGAVGEGTPAAGNERPDGKRTASLRASSWPVVPDPGPALPPVRSLDVGGKKVEGVCFARDVARAVVTQSSRVGSSDYRQVTLYDLERGREIASGELPEGATVVALSPDASSMAVVAKFTARTMDRLVVWQWKGSGLGAQTPIRLADDHHVVSVACFLTPEQLFFRGTRKETHLIDLRSGQSVYSFDVPREQGFAVSPGGRWFVAYDASPGHGKDVQIHEASTGKVAATLKRDYDDWSELVNLAFSPDGKELTLLFRKPHPFGYVLFTWDLETGKSVFQFDLPTDRACHRKGAGIWWCGTDYLLATGILCRRETGAPVWRYKSGIAGQLADGRVWIRVSEYGRSHLVPVELPLAAQEASIEEMASRIRPVLALGEGVRLEVRGAERAPTREFGGELTKILKHRLEKRGYRVEEKARLCLRVSISEETQGEPLEFQYFMGRREGQTFTVPNRTLRLRLELSDSAGAVQWETDMERGVSGGIGGHFVGVDSDPVTSMLNERWELLTFAMRSQEFPVPWYATEAAEDLGETTIDRKALASIAGSQAEEGPGADSARAETAAPTVTLGSGWTYEQDAIPSPTKEFVSKRLRLDKCRLLDARFAGPEAGQVAVLMQRAGDGASGNPAERLLDEEPAKAGRCVERVDLTNSEVLSSFDVPDDAELLDFRLDGRVIAIRIPGESRHGADQLEVWACSGEGDRRVLNCSPYEDRVGAKLTWAALVGTNRLLTRDEWGKTLDLWELPACKRLDSLSWESKASPPLSGQRNYLAAPRLGAMEILRTSDFGLAGHLKGAIVGPRGLSGGAFDREGKRFAAIFANPSRVIAQVWDLERGELLKQFPISHAAPGHRWIDSRYYYAGGTLLDTEEEMAVWKYDHERCIPASPDGRFWYAAVDREGRPFLCATEVPSREVRTVLERCLVAGLVLGPGASVSIQIQREGNPAPELCRRVESAMKDVLIKRGFQVTSGAPITMKITVKDEPYERPYRIPGETSNRRRSCSVSLDLLDGDQWRFWRDYKVDILDDDPGDREQPKVEEFEAWVRSKILPRKLFRWSRHGTPGKSTLTLGDEEINVGFMGR